MPLLSNVKHESFAQNLANGMQRLDAFEGAGYPRNPSSACQIANRPEVKARVEELLQERTERIRVTAANAGQPEVTRGDDDGAFDRAWVVEQLKANVRLAQQQGQISAANKAVELLAEMHNWIGKKAEAPPPEKPAPERPKPSIADLAAALGNMPAEGAADAD